MESLHARDPRQVGTYRLTGRLGAGGMGEVFLGESPDGRKVAVKLLRTEHAADSRFRQRFAREVAAAKLVSGAHTAPVVDADPDGDPPWLVTAYIPGPSLADAVRQGGPLTSQSLRRLATGLAEGLSAIHARGLVHRDLKPGNVILADDGPRIIDFGIARATEATTDLTATGTLIGTVSYMSPEQVSGERVDARSDIFSLGSVLAYAATGRGPFDAPTMPAIATRIVAGQPDLDGIDSPFRDLIAACLAKDPAARPALNAVASYLEHPQTDPTERIFVPAPPPAVPDAPTAVGFEPPRQRRSFTGVAVAALVVAAGAGVAAALLSGGGPSGTRPGTHASVPPATSTGAAPVSPAAGRPGIPPGQAKHKKSHPGGHGGHHGHGGHGHG